MSARNTVVLTTSAKLAPPSASTASRLASTRSVCATTSPSTTCPLDGSSAICPAVKRKPLAAMACEYGPMAAGALAVWMVRGGTEPGGWSGRMCACRRILPRRHEVEKPPGVVGARRGECRGRNTAHHGKAIERRRDPRRLVAPATVRNGSEVGRVGLDEEPVVGHEPQQLVVVPPLEGDDAAERHEPSRLEAGARERPRSGEAVEHATHPCAPRLADHRRRVLLRLAG